MRISRSHSFSAAHRIAGHPGKCRHIHGHNYTVTITVEGEVGPDGMVIDFDVIKRNFCSWLDRKWDHRLLLWEQDPIAPELIKLCEKYETIGTVSLMSFNPTAENMAHFLLTEIAPLTLPRDIQVVEITVIETDKCSAIASCEQKA